MLGNILKNIPGFRSGKKYKKAIAIIYYIFALSMFTQGFEYGLFFLVAPFLAFSLVDLINYKKKSIPLKKVILNLAMSFVLISVSMAGMPSTEPDAEVTDPSRNGQQQVVAIDGIKKAETEDLVQVAEPDLPEKREEKKEVTKPIKQETIKEELTEENAESKKALGTDQKDVFKGYTIIEVSGGNTSGHREPNVAVDIGYGNRVYWAFTNEHGQLVRVIADEIILQDDTKENVNADGRYYSDIADVPGVGADTGYDRGHVIADSLGGVANAYNITPQEATLNRHGDQAYMEKVIRDAGGCTDFEAIITYPNTQTQIPSHYKYTYTLMGNVIVDEFDNVNPDEYNESHGIYDNTNNQTDKSDDAVEDTTEVTYILNTDSKKIHYPDCSSVERMSEKNKKESNLSRDELISDEYDPCGICKP